MVDDINEIEASKAPSSGNPPHSTKNSTILPDEETPISPTKKSSRLIF